MDREPLRSEDRPPSARRRRPAGDPRLLGSVLLATVLAACGSASPSGPTTRPTAVPPIASTAIAVTPTPSPSATTGGDPSPSADPTPSAAPSADPSPSAAPSSSPSPRPYRQDLWHDYALVTQPNLLYCVPGASAIIVNLVRGGRAVDASALAVYPGEGPGVDPAGWVGILGRWGASGYAWHSYATLGDALHHAAARMRATGKPAALVVGIHGQHAWVLTGFSSTADPAAGPFTVTGVAVAGSLWPAQQYYLGYFDMPPGSWLTPAKLAPAVRPFHASVPTQWDGRFVTVEP